MKSISPLIMGVIELILLIAILSGVSGTVLGYLDGLASNLTSKGLSIGSLLATNALGGILWFALCILIVVGVVMLMIRGVSHKGY